MTTQANITVADLLISSMTAICLQLCPQFIGLERERRPFLFAVVYEEEEETEGGRGRKDFYCGQYMRGGGVQSIKVLNES